VLADAASRRPECITTCVGLLVNILFVFPWLRAVMFYAARWEATESFFLVTCTEGLSDPQRTTSVGT
jgi:hypothetical protein